MVIGAVVALILGSWTKAVIVIAVLVGEAFLEQSVLTPNILSYQVGIHPLLVLFSLLVFGMLFGILGLLIAVPVTTILVTVYRAYREELTIDLSEYVTS
jgi:predicted PurR-regulated permease PerM